jgi:hypothetical protein
MSQMGSIRHSDGTPLTSGRPRQADNSRAGWHVSRVPISDKCAKSGCLKARQRGLALSETNMIRGSCLCGGVKYQINGMLSQARNCHCSMCRKAQGAAFRSRASVNVSDFEWVQGENLVTFYESSPGNQRGFCRVCGSPIVSRFGGTSYYGLALGTLDDDPGVQPQLHVHVANKAPWFTITDDLPQFPVGPK